MLFLTVVPSVDHAYYGWSDAIDALVIHPVSSGSSCRTLPVFICLFLYGATACRHGRNLYVEIVLILFLLVKSSSFLSDFIFTSNHVYVTVMVNLILASAGIWTLDSKINPIALTPSVLLLVVVGLLQSSCSWLDALGLNNQQNSYKVREAHIVSQGSPLKILTNPVVVG